MYLGGEGWGVDADAYFCQALSFNFLTYFLFYTLGDLVSDSDDCDLRGDLKFRVAHGGPGGRKSVLRCEGEGVGQAEGLCKHYGLF